MKTGPTATFAVTLGGLARSSTDTQKAIGHSGYSVAFSDKRKPHGGCKSIEARPKNEVPDVEARADVALLRTALSPDFEQKNRGGNGNIQAVNGARHRNVDACYIVEPDGRLQTVRLAA